MYAPPYSLGSTSAYSPAGPSGMHPLMQMLAPLALNAMNDGKYQFDMGMFQAGNRYMNLRERMFQDQHLGMISGFIREAQASALGTGVLSGFANLAGVKFSPEMVNSLNGLVGTVGPGLLSTMAAQNLDTVDTMMGGRSPLVMAAYMHRGGRGLRSYDGSIGLKPADAMNMTTAMWGEFYSGNRPNTLTTARFGQLFEEMAVRGELGGSERLGDGSSNVTDNAKKAIGRKIKLVQAMSEIFGSAGKPNAPMSELLNAIEQFTGGSGNWEATRAEAHLRRLQAAVPSAGLSYGTAQQLIQSSVSDLANMGVYNAAPFASLNTLTAIQSRSAMIYGGYDPTGWGRFSVDQQMLLTKKLVNSATASGQANRLSALMRMAEVAGTVDGAAGERVRLIMKQVSSGNLTDDTLALLSGRQADFENLMREGIKGATSSTVTSFLRAHYDNQATSHRYGIPGIVHEQAQAREVQRALFGRGNLGELSRILGANRGLAELIGKAFGDTVMGDDMTAQERMELAQGTGGSGRAKIGAAIRDALLREASGGGPRAAEAKNLWTELSADPEKLNLMIASQSSAAQAAYMRSGGREGGSWANLIDRWTPQAKRAREVVRTRDELLARVAGATSDTEGATSLAATVMGRLAVFESKDKDETAAQRIRRLFSTMGWSNEVSSELVTNLTRLEERRKALDDEIQNVVSGTKAGPEREIKLKDLEEQAKAIANMQAEINKEIQSNEKMAKKIEDSSKDPTEQAMKTAIKIFVETLTINGKTTEDPEVEADGTTVSKR